MDIKELYNNEFENPISLNSYLTMNGIIDIEEYLNPSGMYLDSWKQYNNMSLAITELNYWLQYEDSKIFIIQDGDTDGICSTVILYNYLKALKEDLDISILIHTSKQRGLEDEDIMDRIKKEQPNLVIIPDAGTNNIKQAQELCDMNIGLIVLDHHDYETPIEKGILINNQDENNINVQKCGSGALVTHKFLQALDEYYNLDWSQYLIDLVALSLISDSMNMSSMENRTYYHFGLETIDKLNNKFLIALFNEFIGDKSYTQKDISFKIVPKLNSICRSTDMELKMDLILSFIGYYSDYTEILNKCKQAHERQKEIVAEVIDKNIDNIDNNNSIVFFASDDIPKSYSGLISGRIMNLCGGKPTIVGSIKDDIFIGSLRSPIPLRSSFIDTKLFEFAQGHEDSCGVKIKAENIPKVVEFYNNIDLNYTPCTEVLKSLNINKYNINRLFYEFDGYDYLWGKGIEQPKFHIKDIVINPSKDIQIMRDGRTIKITYKDTVLMLFMSTKQDKEKLKLGYYENDKFVFQPQDINLKMQCIGTLNINRYKSYVTNQILISDYEETEKTKRTIEDLFN